MFQLVSFLPYTRLVPCYSTRAFSTLRALPVRPAQGVVHLNASRSGVASIEFDALERESTGSIERVLAAFNLGVAAATAGELRRAEAAFTRAIDTLAAGGASRDVTKVVVAHTKY